MKRSELIIPIITLLVLFTACTTRSQQGTETPTSTQTPNTAATTVFERTAIARFTQNPDLASSMTPFYGTILWGEAIRQITETPVFDPERECYLVADFWHLDELVDSIEASLSEIDISVVMEAFVSVVWNSSECNQYIPVSLRMRIWVEPDSDITSSIDYVSTLENVINISLSEISTQTDVPSDLSTVQIAIYLVDSEQLPLLTNLLDISEATANGLTGEMLVEELMTRFSINNP